MTAPHIGNTGVNDEDPESGRIWVSGLRRARPGRRPVVTGGRGARWTTSSRRQGVVGISGIDTRALTRHLRERGAMRVGISSPDTDAGVAAAQRVLAEPADGRRRPDRRGHDRRAVRRARDGEKRFTVAALDLGIKTMTPRRMAERGIEVHVLPADRRRSSEVLATGADGVFLSNGPGDPATADRAVALTARPARPPGAGLRHLLRQPDPRPGARPRHLQAGYGHRGINQPVQDRATGKVEVTAHNHGFAVDAPLETAVRHRRSAASRSATSASTTTSSRACAATTCRPSRCSTTRRPQPARTTRRTCSTASADAARGKAADAAAHRHPQRPGHRLRADRHRPGLRVRLLRHPGLPGAARARACGSSWSTPTRPRS